MNIRTGLLQGRRGSTIFASLHLVLLLSVLHVPVLCEGPSYVVVDGSIATELGFACPNSPVATRADINGAPDAACFRGSDVAGCRCCASVSSQCSTVCEVMSFTTCEARCVSAGGRLCTEAELLDNVAAGSGCDYDAVYIWSSNDCTPTASPTGPPTGQPTASPTASLTGPTGQPTGYPSAFSSASMCDPSASCYWPQQGALVEGLSEKDAAKFSSIKQVTALQRGVAPRLALQFDSQTQLKALKAGVEPVTALLFTKWTQVAALQHGLPTEQQALQFDHWVQVEALQHGGVTVAEALQFGTWSQLLALRGGATVDAALLDVQ